jgi:hypothetical protein
MLFDIAAYIYKINYISTIPESLPGRKPLYAERDLVQAFKHQFFYFVKAGREKEEAPWHSLQQAFQLPFRQVVPSHGGKKM